MYAAYGFSGFERKTLGGDRMLTERQKQVLGFIQEWTKAKGYPPTFREIAEKMGIRSTNGVSDHLKALEKKGYLQRDDLKSRALRPVLKEISIDGMIDTPTVPEDLVSVHVLGRCAAGVPMLATEQIEDTVRVDRFFLGTHREVFALRVHGDSMVEAGILSGDYVFVRKQVTAQPGEIVVAMIGDEATIKYYHPERDHIEFRPANAAMRPIVVERSDFKPVQLLGTVVGVYRKF